VRIGGEGRRAGELAIDLFVLSVLFAISTTSTIFTIFTNLVVAAELTLVIALAVEDLHTVVTAISDRHLPRRALAS
jgi:hypothetical protein